MQNLFYRAPKSVASASDAAVALYVYKLYVIVTFWLLVYILTYLLIKVLY